MTDQAHLVISDTYAKGRDPAIALNSEGVVVAVHLGETSDEMYSVTGKYANGRWTGNTNFVDLKDNGKKPAVALNNLGIVAMAHMASTNEHIFYRLGRVDNGQLSWFGNFGYGTGSNPCVAINDSNKVVLLQQSMVYGTLEYHVGDVTEDMKLDFISEGYLNGYNSDMPGSSVSSSARPSVALNGDGVVVAGYHHLRGPSGPVQPAFQVGLLANGAISWGGEGVWPVDDGSPRGYICVSISLENDDRIVGVFMRPVDPFNSGYHTLVRFGQVDREAKTISWLAMPDLPTYQSRLNQGEVPVTASANEHAIITVGAVTTGWGNQPFQALRYGGSAIFAGEDWMSKNLSRWGDRRLHQLSMPHSHDAGMYETSDHGFGTPQNTQTQFQSIAGQLEDGARSFDIRSLFTSDGDVRIAHVNVDWGVGAIGPSLETVLDDVLNFVKAHAELVILQISHTYSWVSGSREANETELHSLYSRIKDKLGDYLYTGSINPKSATLNNFLNYTGTLRGTVLALVDKISQTEMTGFKGLYKYRTFEDGTHFEDVGEAWAFWMFDHYAKDPNFANMASDQLAKLRNAENHRANMFLLSWTRTLDSEAVNFATIVGLHDSVLGMAEQANAQLWPELHKVITAENDLSNRMPNLIGVDALDSRVTGVTMWMNEHFKASAADNDDTIVVETSKYEIVGPDESKYRLKIGSKLEQGGAIYSPDGKMKLCFPMLEFGPLCVMDTATGNWVKTVIRGESATPPAFLELNAGGVINIHYAFRGQPRSSTWSSGFTASDTSWLGVTNEGDVILYDSHDKPLRRIPDKMYFDNDDDENEDTYVLGLKAAPDFLLLGERMYGDSGFHGGDQTIAPRGNFLVFQFDGNVVLYEPDGATGFRPIWAGPKIPMDVVSRSECHFRIAWDGVAANAAMQIVKIKEGDERLLWTKTASDLGVDNKNDHLNLTTFGPNEAPNLSVKDGKLVFQAIRRS